MHNPVKPKKAASFFKKDFEEHISEPEELNACFVYQDENFQNLHYPSMESDDEIHRKKHLIRKNVKEGQEFLDGPLIYSILTESATVEKEMKKKQNL